MRTFAISAHRTTFLSFSLFFNLDASNNLLSGRTEPCLLLSARAFCGSVAGAMRAPAGGDALSIAFCTIRQTPPVTAHSPRPAIVSHRWGVDAPLARWHTRRLTRTMRRCASPPTTPSPTFNSSSSSSSRIRHNDTRTAAEDGEHGSRAATPFLSWMGAGGQQAALFTSSSLRATGKRVRARQVLVLVCGWRATATSDVAAHVVRMRHVQLLAPATATWIRTNFLL